MRKAALGANHSLWGRSKRSNHGFHVLPPSVEVTAVSRTPLRAGFHICGQEFPRPLRGPTPLKTISPTWSLLSISYLGAAETNM